MQAAAGGADKLGEPRLDVEMNVLQLGGELEAAGLDLLAHLRQSALDGSSVLGRKDALRHQHVGVGYGACDILRVESAIEADGGVDLLHDLGGPELVSSAPHLVGAASRLSRSRVLPCHEYEPIVL